MPSAARAAAADASPSAADAEADADALACALAASPSAAAAAARIAGAHRLGGLGERGGRLGVAGLLRGREVVESIGGGLHLRRRHRVELVGELLELLRGARRRIRARHRFARHAALETLRGGPFGERLRVAGLVELGGRLAQQLLGLGGIVRLLELLR